MQHTDHNSTCISVRWERGILMQSSEGRIVMETPHAYCNISQAYIIQSDKAAIKACDEALCTVR